MSRNSAFDPRPLMERAVEVMYQSVDEVRDDGKACPKVGAVLVRPDGSIATACRGELRDGDHAEFTLLERKSRDVRLDGSVLFATLEPCAPGARQHPKLGCAERIVLARIKHVWVGIEDPEPTVARKGIEYLRRAGVDVQMFEPDLQQVIQEANRKFLDGALKRAAQAKKPPEKVVLSPMEGAVHHVATDDLSPDALKAFREAADITDNVGSTGFNRQLVRLGLASGKPDSLVPTGFGYLLFGRQPRTAMPQAGLLGTIHYSDGTDEIRSFEGPQVHVPGEAIAWLRDKLPNPIDRTGAERREKNGPFFELVREGIVNALVHRDYEIRGAKCQLQVTPDAVRIWSPGRPVEPTTLEQMASFTAPMLSRNPVLHYVFTQMGLAEERGLGLRSLRRRAEELGLPLPQYTWNDPYLILTLYRSAEGAARQVAAGRLESLNADELRGVEFLATRTSATRKEYAEALGLDTRTAQRHLKRLVEHRLVGVEGSGPATTYRLMT